MASRHAPRWFAVPTIGFVLLATLVAGCADVPDDSGAAASTRTSGAAAGAAVPNATLPLTLGTAIDPWKGASELVLFDGVVVAEACGGPVNQAVSTAFSTAFDHEAAVGCADIVLPEGTLIPVGSARLRIEADATQALKSGGFIACLHTMGRTWPEADGDISTDPVHTWVFELTPGDWDAPWWEWTASWMCYWPHGSGPNVLDGPIQTKVVVERDPAWTPRAAPDDWTRPGVPRPQTGVVTLLDVEMPWREQTAAGTVTPWPDVPRLARPVPFGTSEVAVVLKWSPVQGCPPDFTCWLSAWLVTGGLYSKEEVEFGDGWKVYVAPVPDLARVDHPYANATGWLDPFLYGCGPDACTADQTESAANLALLGADRSTQARFVVEAWKGPVDLAALKARLGLG